MIFNNAMIFLSDFFNENKEHFQLILLRYEHKILPKKVLINYIRNDNRDLDLYMNDIDFFKYFNKIEICYLFLNSEEVIYEIDEDNIKNAGVFIIETQDEGYLNVSIPRENWRVHRDLINKNQKCLIFADFAKR